MALPLSRVMEITIKASEVLQDYQTELQQAFAKGDLMKVGEIRTCVNLLHKIIILANKPYVDQLRPMISDETLRSLGLLDDEGS